jgi:hypothetical protein
MAPLRQSHFHFPFIPPWLASHLIHRDQRVAALVRIDPDHDLAHVRPFTLPPDDQARQRGHASIEQKRAPIKPHPCRPAPAGPHTAGKATSQGLGQQRNERTPPDAQDPYIDAKKTEAALTAWVCAP